MSSALGITAAPQAPSTAPAAITAGSAQVYKFAQPMRRAVVAIDPDYAGKLKIMWNAETASATVWMDSASAGDRVASPEDIAPFKLSIYAEGADAVLGTAFSVYGLHE